MKKMLIVASMLLAMQGYSQQWADLNEGDVTCHLGGDKPVARFMKADSLKNRYTVPTKYNEIKFAEMASLKYNDKSHSQNEAVYLHGWVIETKNGGSETCNCHTKNTKWYDTHIVISNDPKDDDASHGIVVEVTPRLRGVIAKSFGVTWDECDTKYIRKKILGHEVIISGYLFDDEEHKTNSVADQGKGNRWRGTCWEIHPLCSIKIID